MSSFTKIKARRRIGANIIITTEHHNRIFSLIDWNMLGFRAPELAHVHNDLKAAIQLAEILQ